MTIRRCTRLRTSRPATRCGSSGSTLPFQPDKTGFRGAEEHYRLKGKERFKIFGVLADTDKILDAGDELYAGDRKVGVVTCGMYSRRTKRSLAIARLTVDAAKQGVSLEVRGRSIQCAAKANPINFDDPGKTKRKAM